MIATTKEQAERLIELGLPIETADMCYSEEYSDDGWFWRINACEYKEIEGLVPAWSLSALLEVVKQVNCISYLTIDSFYLIRCKDNGFIWQKDIMAKDPVTAACGMVEWLLKNGYIKKGGEQ